MSNSNGERRDVIMTTTMMMMMTYRLSHEASPHVDGGSDVESDDDNEDGDYTVFECRGLATVSNNTALLSLSLSLSLSFSLIHARTHLHTYVLSGRHQLLLACPYNVLQTVGRTLGRREYSATFSLELCV